jgi:hypothetical protein
MLDGELNVNLAPAVCSPKKRTNLASEATYHLKMMLSYGVIPRMAANRQCGSGKVFSIIWLCYLKQNWKRERRNESRSGDRDSGADHPAT